MKKILVIGGGFGGINVVKVLRRCREAEILLVDQNNYHLFQPLLYQVATGGLSASDIAVPIRSLFSKNHNVCVFKEKVESVDLKRKIAFTNYQEISYDYLVMACGIKHSYFGRKEWEEYAPGLKNLEQALEIRRRILEAFESAESAQDAKIKDKFLTFVVVGGGPTGVELAGAIAEMGQIILRKDFRNVNVKRMRVVLIEAGERILAPFHEKMSTRAKLDLESLGVEVRLKQPVTNIDMNGVEVGGEKIDAATVLWAAGIEAHTLNKKLGVGVDSRGRVIVEPDLSIKGYPEAFAIGDQVSCLDRNGQALAGVATVAIEQGIFVGKTILREMQGLPRKQFQYYDRGKAATVGRSKAIMEIGEIKVCGIVAWLMWLLVHIWSLTGFENRVLVFLKWAWVYIWHHHGARIIWSKNWRFYGNSVCKAGG